MRHLLCLLLAAGAAHAADWSQWMGPNRDGTTAEKVEPWTEPPKQLWSKKVGVGHSSPVVADGMVFIHARVKGKEKEEVIAFDAKTGEEKWRTGYDRAPYSSILNTGPQATPTVSGGKVYGFGITGVLSCFDAEKGTLLWTKDALKDLRVDVPRFGVCCSPLVVGGKVLVAVGGKGSAVVAFDAKSGDVAWQKLDEQANTSSPVLFAGEGQTVPDAVFMTTLRVVGLNPLDGSVNWEYPLPFQPGGTSPTPLVTSDMVITSTMDNGTTAVKVKGGDKPKAEKAWQGKKLSGYFSSGTTAGDKLFLVTNVLKPMPRADLVCVDLKKGEVQWKQESVGYFHFAAVRTGNDKLLILDDSGTLKLIDATAKEYKELCAAKVCDGMLTSPAVADGKVYVRDGDKVVCVQLGK
jgi:outer membrane protein assembly factor BamB